MFPSSFFLAFYKIKIMVQLIVIVRGVNKIKESPLKMRQAGIVIIGDTRVGSKPAMALCSLSSNKQWVASSHHVHL